MPYNHGTTLRMVRYTQNDYAVPECSERCVKISGGNISGTEGARIIMHCAHGELKLEWRNGAWKRI